MDNSGRDLPELDPAIHPQTRLQIMTTLCTLQPKDRLAFPRLQEMLGLTPGNLSTHLMKLEEAGYVTIEKAFQGRTPVTWVGVTSKGRNAFERYLEALGAYLKRGRN